MELYPGVVGHRRDCGGAAVVEFHLGGWACGAPFGPRVPRIGPVGQIQNQEFEKGIPAICRGRHVSRQIFRRQQFSGGSNFQAAAICRERFVDVGFDAPEWGDVA